MSDSHWPLQLRKAGDDWDWYVLETERYGRISDADVEGTAEEWRAVAAAMKAGESVSFKRLSAKHVGNDYQFCSPRNTMGHCGVVTGTARCIELVAMIEKALDEGEKLQAQAKPSEDLSDG